jgi:hypothetical protein
VWWLSRGEGTTRRARREPSYRRGTEVPPTGGTEVRDVHDQALCRPAREKAVHAGYLRAEIPRPRRLQVFALVRYELFFNGAVELDNLMEILDTVYLPLITTVSNTPAHRSPRNVGDRRRK